MQNQKLQPLGVYTMATSITSIVLEPQPAQAANADLIVVEPRERDPLTVRDRVNILAIGSIVFVTTPVMIVVGIAYHPVYWREMHKARRITDEMCLSAAEALADKVTDKMVSQGILFPPLHDIRKISERIAMAVAKTALKGKTVTDLNKKIRDMMWEPRYLPYRFK